MHVTASSSAIRRLAPPSDAPLILVADGSPPHAHLERALLGALPATPRLWRHDWESLLTDDAVEASDRSVIVVAVLITPSRIQSWRQHPGFSAIMRRAILVAPLPRDAGEAVVGACGLGSFVPLDHITTDLGRAVEALACRLSAPPPSPSRPHDDPTPPQRLEE